MVTSKSITVRAERALRVVALGRKNYLFAGSDAGGERAAAIYSLLGSAKLNGIDSEAYLGSVLRRIADHPIWPVSPWSVIKRHEFFDGRAIIELKCLVDNGLDRHRIHSPTLLWRSYNPSSESSRRLFGFFMIIKRNLKVFLSPGLSTAKRMRLRSKTSVTNCFFFQNRSFDYG
jgi:hypothetical protein